MTTDSKSTSTADLAILGGTPAVDRTRWPRWPPRLPGLAERLGQVAAKDEWGVGSETVRQFEEAFARYHEGTYALAMANGTVALMAALEAAGTQTGDEVIIPAYTFMASAAAVLQLGARPVFADIDAQTFNLDPADAARRITSRTRAIMPVHIGGNPADMAAFNRLAEQHGLAIIEDAAQAHGAIYDGRKVGALGLAGCFSFQSSKNMTSGEGGLLLTNSREAYERAFRYYNCGRPVDGPWHEHRSPGLNLRLSAFQAAVLLHQLDQLEDWAATREANGRYLEGRLNELPGITCAGRYAETDRNAYHLFIFTYDAAEFDDLPKARFLEALNAEGVPASEGYRPLPSLPFLDGDSDTSSWPVTERVCRDAVWLRQWALLGERDLMDGIVQAVEKVRAGAVQLTS